MTELKAAPNDSVVVIAFPEISLVQEELFEISLLVRLVFGPVVEKFVVMKF